MTSSIKKFIRNALIFIAGALLVSLTVMTVSYFSKTAGDRNITFSNPLAVVKDSDSTEVYIFDENAQERYMVFFYDDMLSDVVRRDSTETVYSLTPKYRKAKYSWKFEWAGIWPEYSDSVSMEKYQPQVRMYLMRIDIKKRVKMFLEDGFRNGDLSTLFRPSYRDMLPDTLSFDIAHDFGPYYFVSLSTRPYVVMVPDRYWKSIDVIAYSPYLVDISKKKISGESIDFKLGEYDVWESTDFDAKDYSYVMRKVNSDGYYTLTFEYNR